MEKQLKTVNMKKLFILLFLIPIISNAQFDPISNNSLRVEGIYITKEIPEQIEFLIDISIESMNYQICSDSTFLVIEKLKSKFQENGLDGSLLRIRSLSINENINWHEGKRINNGFLSNAKLEVKEIYKNEFIQKIFKSIQDYSELNYSIRFSLSENQKEKLRKIALEKSILDAKEKAKIIAQENNLILVKINKILYGDQWDLGFNSNLENDLINEEIIPIYRQTIEYKNIDFNPPEISIKKIVTIEWIFKEKK